MDFYTELYRIMTFDAGNRGLCGPMPNLPELGASLLRAERVLILTGFPVFLGEDSVLPVGETDGPPGTAELAAALENLGCPVFVATDQPSFPMVTAALKAATPAVDTIQIPKTKTKAFAADLLDRLHPSHLIALERPGKGADGHFHSMRGGIIDQGTADTDCFLTLARQRGITTIGIGDGGNELGMGTLRGLVARSVPHGEEIAAWLPADYTLTSGVSNWWGAGLAALLSYESGKDLLISDEEACALLLAVMEAGGVDGCTGMHTMTVDGLPLSAHQDRRQALRRLLDTFQNPCIGKK